MTKIPLAVRLRLQRDGTAEEQPAFARPQGLQVRFWRVSWFFTTTMLHLYLWDHILIGQLGMRWLQPGSMRRHVRLATAFRTFAIEMGGVMIKLGQFFSARADIMPPEVTTVLSGLQDEVEPVPWYLIEQQLERELGAHPDRIYASFDRRPVGAASLGQVHQATLADGQIVAVKIQRPGIRAIVETDLQALALVLNILRRFEFIRRRANLDALLEEFSASLLGELDYIQEGRQAEQFRDNFKDEPRVGIPLPHWPLTTLRVLTLEWIEGIKINNYAALEAAGISRGEVATFAANAYFKQFFEDGLFHADPHPGNLFIQPLGDPNEWPPATADAPTGRPFRLVFVDFGMIGTIPAQGREFWRRLVVATVNRDSRGYVSAMKDLGFLLPTADERAIVAAVDLAMSRYYGMSLDELQQAGLDEFQEVGSEIREVFYSFPFQVPQNFVLLGRCVGLLVGLAIGLDPAFSPFDVFEPYARKLLGTETPKLSGQARDQLFELLRLSIGLPPRLDRTLQLAETGQLSIRQEADPEMLMAMGRVEGAINRLTDTVALVALVVAARQLPPEQAGMGRLLWAATAWVALRIAGRR